jgi:hypothetical protein
MRRLGYTCRVCGAFVLIGILHRHDSDQREVAA